MLPMFYPSVRHVPHVPLDGGEIMTVAALCERVGLSCMTSGPCVERKVAIQAGAVGIICSEPNNGSVTITVPHKFKNEWRYRWALAALAYSTLFDPVARASIKHAEWRKPALPKETSI